MGKPQDKLNELFLNDERMFSMIKTKANLWRAATKALEGELPISKKVDALAALGPREAALLLAESTTTTASIW